MNRLPAPLDLMDLRVYPLAERRSLSGIDDILVDPETAPPACGATVFNRMRECAGDIRRARERGASVLFMYGAHLVKNGGSSIVDRLIGAGWVTHLATNGAGSIHDWEFAFGGRSTESVKENVASGTFGTWDETGRSIHLALLAGALRGEGYGAAVGRFIEEEGVTLPEERQLEETIRDDPRSSLTAARAELLHAMTKHRLVPGPHRVPHPWKHHSIFANAFRRGVPLTVHPGIGYDIISNHPMFSGAAIGRAAEIDFRLIAAAIEQLDGGVVMSVGSAIMAPQVFEKSVSCVNNLRLQAGRPVVHDHSFFVIDLQDGGSWDWSVGEPPRDNPAYYLRFCKTFSRMGGKMNYLQCDNVAFVHHLWHQLSRA